MFIISDFVGYYPILKRDNLHGEPLERKRCARIGTVLTFQSFVSWVPSYALR
jgi:hypothetical protein